MKRAAAILMFTVLLLCGWASRAGAQFASAFDRTPDRPWIGPEYWANPLQDWRIAGGALECIMTGPARSLMLLTRELSDRPAPFSTSIAIQPWKVSADKTATGWVGFRIAARGRFGDYRDDAVYGKGIEAGLRADGSLFIGDSSNAGVGDAATIGRLQIELLESGGGWSLGLSAYDAQGRARARTLLNVADPRELRGAIGIVCNDAPCRIGEWHASGPKLDAHDDRAFGPILFTQYTLSRRVMKLTAQMAPLGPSEPREARLSVRAEGSTGAWHETGRATIDPLARTATFRVTDWDDTRDHEYRVSYESRDTKSQTVPATFDGAIRRDPRDKTRTVVAAFTGNNDLGFPHADVVKHVSTFEPHLLIFTGDQIYEPVGGFGVQRAPLDMATLDYLRKWFMYGWEYRDLLRSIPSIALPDDHDVYHGNIWGAGGRDANDIVPALQREGVGVQTQKQDSGGFTMPVDWVNMVQRTQTSHLPDPVDPDPAQRGIGVYFTELVWGGVSYAIIEDRKWKSAPAVMLPEAQIVNGWARNPDWDSSKTGDVNGADLLGPRQMRFLEQWAGDRSADVWMKALVSQTIFANVATLPRGSRADDITTKLPIQPPGGYAPGEAPVQDHDSNGWPQSPRLAALRLMKRAGAIHITGDQHLGMTIQYGIDGFRDGPFAICVPSVANFWPRRWFPEQEGADRQPGAPRNTGDYLDGFGNRMTVLAVSNPFKLGVEPADINDRAPGYGIITFDRPERTITLANWPRWVDPKAPGAKPYPGWPVTVRQEARRP
jgi:alkaline phosphatase D